MGTNFFSANAIVRVKENDLFVNLHKPHVIRNHYTRSANMGVDVYPTFDNYENAKAYNPDGYVKKVVVSIPGSPVCDLGFPLRYVNIPTFYSEYDAKNIARASYTEYVYNTYNENLLTVMRLQHMILTNGYWSAHITSKWVD